MMKVKPPPSVLFSTLEQLKTAVDNILSLNRPYYDLGLSGGEPTIHPHVFDLISMFYENLGNRLNSVSIVTNGSRNESLYSKIAELAKFTNFMINVSIHTDHVDMKHILELIETLSHDVKMNFLLMFNPAKREFVHEIYETMFDTRKHFPFSMNVVLLRDNKLVDPRYTPEDFNWQKKANNQFSELTRNISFKASYKRLAHSTHIFHEVEDKGEQKIIPLKNRTLNFNNGLLNFKGMYCMCYVNRLTILVNGRCTGITCNEDKSLCNIYDKDCFKAVLEKLIHAVKCSRSLCGCGANDRVLKFALEEEANKYLEFAQKRQAELFAEYDAAHALKNI